jgi:hypothetical protein
MKKSSMLIFALFLAALIFIAQKPSASNIACHKNRFWLQK